MMTVPEMVCRALDLEPYTEEIAAEDTRCSFCGVPIAKGDYCKTKALQALGADSFTSDASLACRTNVACKWCPPCMTKEVLQKLPNTVVTKAGLFAIGKDENREWFFRTPPAPPFAAFFVTAKMAHVAWRTPLTLDKNLITVRLNDQLLTIRHDRLMQGIEDCKRAGELLAEAGAQKIESAGKKHKKVIFVRNHPFVSLDREIHSTTHGQLLPQFVALAGENSEAATIANRLSTLSKGELFALATLAKAKPVAPVAAPRIIL